MTSSNHIAGRLLSTGLGLIAALVVVGGAPSGAKADVGLVARAFVLPATIVERVSLSEEDELAFTLSLPTTVDADFLRLDAPHRPDNVRNVVNLLGRGMDVGMLHADDELTEGRVYLQLQTKLSSRRVQLRCRVRFD